MNKNLKILLIDDDEVILKLLKTTLEKVGYLVTTFSKAIKAKEYILNIEKGEYAALIVDYQMPDINGLDFIDAVKKIPNLVDIPIIMLSGTDDILIAQQAFVHGVTCFLCKDQHTASYIDSRIHAAMNAKDIELIGKKLYTEA